MAGLWTWASLSPGISALPVRTLAHIWRVEGHKGALQALPCTNACVVTSRSGFSSCVRFLAPDSSRHSACPARGCRRRSKRGKPFPGSMSYRVKKVITPPINQIFRYLQNQDKLQIWLYDHKDLRIEGTLIGFDEYMNLTVDNAEEISVKHKTPKPLGRILLKGDNITLMAPVGSGGSGA